MVLRGLQGYQLGSLVSFSSVLDGMGGLVQNAWVYSLFWALLLASTVLSQQHNLALVQAYSHKSGEALVNMACFLEEGGLAVVLAKSQGKQQLSLFL